MFGENDAHQWVKTFIDQCRTGKLAELSFCFEKGHLKVTMSADLGPVVHNNVHLSGCTGVQSGSPCRVRRRERRAAERAAAENAAAVKVAAERNAAEKVAAEQCIAKKAGAEKHAAEKAAAEMHAAEKAAEKCATKKAAAEKCAAERAAAEKCAIKKAAAEKCAAEEAATVKCAAKQAAAEKCAMEKAAAEKCAAKTADAAEEATTSVSGKDPTATLRPKVPPPTPVPLPLCHYCCHKGSGQNPVHYYEQCLCPDKVCSSCKCYCTEEQLKHKLQFFPPGSSSIDCVSAKDRPMAEAVAEKRIGQWPICPCTSEDCAKPVIR